LLAELSLLPPRLIKLQPKRRLSALLRRSVGDCVSPIRQMMDENSPLSGILAKGTGGIAARPLDIGRSYPACVAEESGRSLTRFDWR
jgi:hypothetical protein